MGASERSKTTAILPVKRLDQGLQRLGAAIEQSDRRLLAEAMFLDTAAKLRRSTRIDEVLVVTADDTVARQARWMGHSVLRQRDDLGHPHAAAAGARAAQADGAERVAMLPVDCPMLDVNELDDRLGVTPRAAMIVPDANGSGTNALMLSPPDAFEPAFGPDSCARHVSRARAAGISFALEHVPSLARDLDTPDDMVRLRDALVLDPEAAPKTAKLLWELGAAERAAA